MAAPDDRAALLADLFDWMARGGLLRQFARDNGIPTSTLYGWATSEEFAERYARARESQAHALAEQAIGIADGTDEMTVKARTIAELEAGVLEPNDRKAFMASFTNAQVQRDRLRMDVRKWYTAKVYPKVFGEKVDVTSDGKRVVGAVIALPTEELPKPVTDDGAAG